MRYGTVRAGGLCDAVRVMFRITWYNDQSLVSSLYTKGDLQNPTDDPARRRFGKRLELPPRQQIERDNVWREGDSSGLFNKKEPRHEMRGETSHGALELRDDLRRAAMGGGSSRKMRLRHRSSARSGKCKYSHIQVTDICSRPEAEMGKKENT